jgi:hypothetical protein
VITYGGRRAFRITDGRTEAVIVPALGGRVMRYGFVGGPNQLWNAPADKPFRPDEWRNVGGDKVWPAPQSQWPGLAGNGWPPPATFDRAEHQATVLPAGRDGSPPRLRTVGPVMVGFGTRIEREYSLDPATGDLVIGQTLRKETGPAVQVAIWSVTQVPPPAGVLVPLNPQSPYKNNFYWFGGTPPKEARTEAASPNLLLFRPTIGFYKLGADTPIAAVTAVRSASGDSETGATAFVIRARKAEGAYPEGAEGSGFPVTVWNQGEQEPGARYVELESMSPLRALKPGETLSYPLRWSLHRLPSGDVDRAEVRAAVDTLLRAPLP